MKQRHELHPAAGYSSLPFLVPGVVNRLAIPVSELPPLTPGRACIGPARNTPAAFARELRMRASRLSGPWASLLVPVAVFALALIGGPFDAMPAWVWLSVMLFATGIMLEMHE